MNIIIWLQAHAQDIVTILGGVVIAARVIVKLTPTPKDDTLLETFVNGLKHIGLHIEKK
jgi:hypothetical protein